MPSIPLICLKDGKKCGVNDSSTHFLTRLKWVTTEPLCNIVKLNGCILHPSHLKQLENLCKQCRKTSGRVETRTIFHNDHNFTLLEADIYRRCCDHTHTYWYWCSSSDCDHTLTNTSDDSLLRHYKTSMRTSAKCRKNITGGVAVLCDKHSPFLLVTALQIQHSIWPNTISSANFLLVFHSNYGSVLLSLT